MRTFAAALVAGLVAATPMTDMEFKFINYVAKFNKSYGTKEEYAFRMEQFAAKELAIQEENASQNSYTLAHNKMSDWTHDEYRQLLGGLPDFEQGTTAPRLQPDRAFLRLGLELDRPGRRQPRPGPRPVRLLLGLRLRRLHGGRLADCPRHSLQVR